MDQRQKSAHFQKVSCVTDYMIGFFDHILTYLVFPVGKSWSFTVYCFTKHHMLRITVFHTAAWWPRERDYSAWLACRKCKVLSIDMSSVTGRKSTLLGLPPLSLSSPVASVKHSFGQNKHRCISLIQWVLPFLNVFETPSSLNDLS